MVNLAEQPLSNIQLELLKLYSTGISDEHLLEIKEMIAKYLFDKAKDHADLIWEQKNYSQNTVNQWLNED